MHSDHEAYHHFTTRSRLDKSINALLGIVEGLLADAQISDTEILFLEQWARDHESQKLQHPISELRPLVMEALADGVISQEEREDILWLCRQLQSTQYHDSVTADMQHLHGMMAGIAADGKITEAELACLASWLRSHDQLRMCWPYDEVGALITAVMRDSVIDPREHDILLSFFNEFAASSGPGHIAPPSEDSVVGVTGLCAVCPEISIESSLFCFTGASADFTRVQFVEMVTSLGGRVSPRVTQDLDYLVVGADGNPYWAYAAYGRKVETAVKYRKNGCKLLLIHEHDFRDAVQDAEA